MNLKTTHLIVLIFMLLNACGQEKENSTGVTTISYHQDDRPQLHYSANSNWMGVPVSSVFFEEEYHLFYQSNTKNGAMNWGHAVGTDLLHWDELKTALSPDDKGEIYPGSVVIDWNYTSGFNKDGEPPLVAIYSYKQEESIQNIAIAYSIDLGRTWEKYDNNPILSNPKVSSFHDPKVLWESESKQWLMLVSTNDRILFYGSPDLKKWQYLSEFGNRKGTHAGQWGCPDLFSIFVPETGDKRWVLLTSIKDGAPNGGSGVQYFIGKFDGKKFKLDQEFAPSLRRSGEEEKAVWLDYGRDHHAAVNWSDIEKNDGRNIVIGCMNNWDYSSMLPTDMWQGTMTFPRVINLHSTVNGPRIFQSFPDELKELRKQEIPVDLNGTFTGAQEFTCSPQQLEVILEAAVTQDTNTVIGFKLSNDGGDVYTIGFNAEENNYFSDRTNAGDNGFSNKFAKKLHLAPKQQDGSLISMHLLFDVTSCELIADDGLTVMSEQFFPANPFTTIEFFVDGLSIDIQRLEVFELKGIWGN